MIELATDYLGLHLASPLVASASPHNRDADVARRLEAAGAAAIVLPSLFEEEIVHDEIQLARALHEGADHGAEASSYFPDLGDVADLGDHYLADLQAVKAAVGVPVIASLNATSVGGWVRYAGLLASAGADALELNLYHVAADPRRSAAAIEEADIEVVAAVREQIRVPLAVKLSPYYSSLANFASRVVAAGADGLVLFNRFYQPDLDLDSFEVVPRVELSQPWELRLPMRWIAILRAQLRTRCSLAATSGIASAGDAVKALMVGADVAMMTSALLRHGPEHLAEVTAGLAAWMEEHGYRTVDELRGAAGFVTAGDPAAFERANYLRTLHSWSTPLPPAPAVTPATA